MARDGTRKGFVVSAFLHAGFFGVLGLMIFMKQFMKEPEPLVMDLVSPPGDAMPTPSQPVAEAAPQMPDIAAPQVESVKQVKFADIPDPQPAPPEPTPPPPEPTPPKPTPTPTPPKPVEKKPEPKKPEPPQPQKVSAADFFKENKRPQATTVTRPATTTAKPAPRIDTSGITSSLQDMLADSSSTSQMSQAEQDALGSYFSRLRQQIRIAWQKPTLANSDNEWVEVIITVQANGRISSHRVSRKSASPEMLRSVISAVNNARSIGPTPDGRSHEVKYTLRLRDE